MTQTSNKDINELWRKATRLGWKVFVTGRRHIRWVPPDDIVAKYAVPFVTTSLSPSDTYAINQIERDLRKAGLWHLEEELPLNGKQTNEEKFISLGTSLPIPVNQNPTLADVAPPELVNQHKPPEADGMAKSKGVRTDRSQVREELLKLLSDGKVHSTKGLFEDLPAKLKVGGLSFKSLPALISTINRGTPGLIGSPQRGLYQYTGGKPQPDPVRGPEDPLTKATEIMNRLVTDIAELEAILHKVKEQHAAVAAVRKLLGA